MKDDTISRAAALGALDRLEYTPGEWATNGMTMCKDAIKALPSATDTNVATTDTISRQAAIDATVKMFEAWYGGSVLRDREIRARFDALPSAQLAKDLLNTCTDVIGRQAAIETVRKAQSIGQAHRMLMQLPSAQKYGTWIVSHFGANAKCSKCGMYCVGAYDHDRCDQYCRCCGAKMDGLKLEGEEP